MAVEQPEARCGAQQHVPGPLHVRFGRATGLVQGNERYIQMYRLPRDAVKPGCTIRELLALRKASGTFWGDVEEYSTNLRARIAEGRTFNSIVETADGRVTVIVDHPIEGGGWVATFEDITERRRVEQERDRSQKFLNTILENAPIPIFVKEANGLRYVLVNRAGEKFWGTSRAPRIDGKTSHDVFPKEEADLIAARDKQLLQSDQPFFDERRNFARLAMVYAASCQKNSQSATTMGSHDM